MAIDWSQRWQELNARQQHFLRVLYETECRRAAYYNSQKAMFDPLKKGAEWRWLVHNPVTGGGLQDELFDDAQVPLNNQGSGSTYKKLEECGYLDRRWEPVEVYAPAYGTRIVQVLSVRLTPGGRKLAKMNLTELPDPLTPEQAREERLCKLKRTAESRLTKLSHRLAFWDDLAPGAARLVCEDCQQEVRIEAAAPVRSRLTGPALDGKCPVVVAAQERKYLERTARPCFLLGAGWVDVRALSQAVAAHRAGRDFVEVWREADRSSALDPFQLRNIERGGCPLYADWFGAVCRWLGREPEEFLVAAPADAGSVGDKRLGYYGPSDYYEPGCEDGPNTAS